MGKQLEFDLSLTESFSSALKPVTESLTKTEQLLSKVQNSTRAFMTLTDHMKVAEGFAGLFGNIRQSSLSLQQHAAIAQSLGGFFGNLGRMAEESGKKTKRLKVEWGNLFHSFAGFRFDEKKDTWIFNVSEGLRAVGSLARSAASAVFSLTSSIVHAAGEAQDLNLALRLNVGEAGAASVSTLAESFRNTRFGENEIKRALLPFLDVGLTDTRMLDDLTTAAADFSARRGLGAEGFQDMMRAFADVAAKGQVEEEVLKKAGVTRAAFFTNLGKLIGHTKDTAKDMTEQGKVKNITLLSVLLDEMAKRQGGAIGGAALEGAKTMGGTLERLSNLSGNVLRKISDGQAMKAVQASLDRFIEKMNGPLGDKLMAAVDSVLVKLVWVVDHLPQILDKVVTASEVIATIWAGSKIVGAVSTLTTLMPVLGTVTGSVVGVMTAVSAPILAIAAAVAAVGVAIARVKSTVDELGGWEQVKRDFKDWWNDEQPASGDGPAKDSSPAWRKAKAAGKAAADGFSSGIQEGADAASAAMSRMADTSVDAMSSALEIHSPSRVMAGIGQRVAEGFAMGMEGGAGLVDEAARRGLAEAAFGPLRTGAPTGGGGGSRVFHAELHLHGVRGDTRELMSEFEQSARRVFLQLMDDVGDSAGAAEAA